MEIDRKSVFSAWKSLSAFNEDEHVRLSAVEHLILHVAYYHSFHTEPLIIRTLNNLTSIQNFILLLIRRGPTDAELAQMLLEEKYVIGTVLSLEILTSVMTKLKRVHLAEVRATNDTIEAFVALGGGPSMDGAVAARELRETIKAFALTIDIDALITEVDTDHRVSSSLKSLKKSSETGNPRKTYT